MKAQSGIQQEGQLDVSVIIVNWNTRELLQQCLHSVYSTINNQTREVIVVDNASSDGSRSMLEQDFPDVIKIFNQQNRGFGAANNQGFAIMKGKYALLLNTDAILTEGAVSKLFLFAENRADAAIVCGQLLNADGSKQNSIASFPRILTLLANTSLLEYIFPQSFPSKRYEHREPLAVDSAIGACIMIRRAALADAGFFDERYFFFMEETDMAYGMRQKGWKVYQVPDARIYHLQGQSVGHQTQSRIEFYRSRYQFLQKWHSLPYYHLATVIIFLRLSVNWLFSLATNILTLGTVKKFREKFTVCSQLIIWHWHKQ
ncbi:MAG TPA: glycosyltransferase family 2 protein [Smithellaceae bacterium]|nr:glycosyltransferase family 2 protein [Smithellaceae bacterium]